MPSQLRSAISRPERAQGRRSRGVQRLGRATDRRRLPAGKLLDDDAQFAQTRQGLCQRCRRWVRPQIPGLSPGGLGPHLTSSGFPCGLSSGFPFARRGSSPFVRRPLVSLRPAFSGSFPSAAARFRFPSVSLRVPYPLGNLHVNAAAGRFRGRRSQAAGTKVTSSAATTSPGSRDPPALSDGQRLGTMGCRHRIACYERPPSQNIAAPEPPISVRRRARLATGPCVFSSHAPLKDIAPSGTVSSCARVLRAAARSGRGMTETRGHEVRSGRGSALAIGGRRRRGGCNAGRERRWRSINRTVVAAASSTIAGAIASAAAASARRSGAGLRPGAGAGDQVTVTDSHHPALRTAPSWRRQCPRDNCTCRSCHRLWPLRAAG